MKSHRVETSMRSPLIFLSLLFGIMSTIACSDPPRECGIEGIDVSANAFATAWFLDHDGDGFGDATEVTVACVAPSIEWVKNPLDCNDANSEVHPDATDTSCDGVDSNCDGQTDEDGMVSSFLDADGDGYGNETATPVIQCEVPDGFAPNNDDCNDDLVAINPNASDICDHVDNNCNNIVDEDAPIVCFTDADGDHYGDPMLPVTGCPGECPEGSAEDGTDCDDTTIARSPGRFESCDALDNDCDSATPIDIGTSCVGGSSPVPNPANGHLYFVAWNQGADFDLARLLCTGIHYNPLWVEDQAEADFILPEIANVTPEEDEAWLGLEWEGCGVTGIWQRIDERTDPPSCTPLSIWEEDMIGNLQGPGGILWSEAGVRVESDIEQLHIIACEVEL
jgi:hypothetical protein